MSELRFPPLRPEPIPLGTLLLRALVIYRAHPVMFPLIALVTVRSASPPASFTPSAATAATPSWRPYSKSCPSP